MEGITLSKVYEAGIRPNCFVSERYISYIGLHVDLVLVEEVALGNIWNTK